MKVKLPTSLMLLAFQQAFTELREKNLKKGDQSMLTKKKTAKKKTKKKKTTKK